MLNLFFVFISGLLAHLLPAELLLVAYALLGPAHYLSEISWLHDRKYFSSQRWYAGVLLLATLLIIIFPGYWDIFIWSAISLAIAVTLIPNRVFKLVFLFLSLAVYFLFYQPYTTLSLILMLLVPTIIHVYFFTLMFMVKGYLQFRDRAAASAIVAVLLISISFFVLPSDSYSLFPGWANSNLSQLSGIWLPLAKALGFSDGDSLKSLFKFVSFAYTFHFLNWFSKTGNLGWHKASRLRIVALTSLYLFSLGLYIYDYKMGLKTLYFLSVLHVILEFPLNIITGKSLLTYMFIRADSRS